jgi:hypothetical protein
MAHAYVLWVVVIAAALHVMEEHTLDWKSWAEVALHAPVTWADFYVTNAAMIVAGVAGAAIGWQRPEISLILPALFVVNALVFHIGISIVQRRYSPGTFTAVVLYLTVAVWAYASAHADGVLSASAIIWSAIGGVLMMAYPLVLLHAKRWVHATGASDAAPAPATGD